MLTLHVTEQEFHVVLAALRLYQAHITGIAPDMVWIHHIATNVGSLAALDAAGIDAFCERINTTSSHSPT